VSEGGLSRKTAELTSGECFAENGRFPSRARRPRCRTRTGPCGASIDSRGSAPVTCTGRYPTTCPVSEIVTSSLPPAHSPLWRGLRELGEAKVQPLIRPSCVTITFERLQSRCTIPFSCAATSASAVGSPDRALSEGSPAGAVTKVARSPALDQLHGQEAGPGHLLDGVQSDDVGMLRLATAFASRSKRARRSGDDATASGSTLTAMSRPSRVSRAR